MLITIDGQQVENFETSDCTIGDVLANVKNGLSGSGRMIVSIICDGQTLVPEKIETVLRQPATTFSQIDFQTAEPSELARNSLDACLDLLIDIEKNCASVVEFLQQAQVQEAMNLMNDLFFKLQSAFQGMEGIYKLLGIDPESVELASGNAQKFNADLIKKLQDVKLALENRDYVGLADLFQYELIPIVQQWQELINHLLETVSED